MEPRKKGNHGAKPSEAKPSDRHGEDPMESTEKKDIQGNYSRKPNIL
jgi:hypothetical protein